MEIAYDQIFILLFQCVLIGTLLLGLFKLRTIFGLGLLYITLGVFQFIQIFLSSALLVEVVPGFFVSSGSMVIFTGSLFAVLLIYIREDALEARKIIYALIAANIILGLLFIIFTYSINDVSINNVYNLPKEFFSHTSRVIVIGTIVLLIDTFAIIYIYEFISKRTSFLFFRILLTMTLVLSLDSLLFSFGAFSGIEGFRNILISGITSKTLAVIVYSSMFSIYLSKYDKKPNVSDSRSDSYKDIFNTLTFRQKFEDAIEKMEITSQELLETQEIAQLGSYVLNVKTGKWTSSAILNDIFGIDLSYKRDIDGWLQLIHSEDRVMMKDYLSTIILTNQEKFNKEYRILNKMNDKIIWVHGMGNLESDDNGNLIKMVGTIQDITARKKVEIELTKSERKFSTVFHQNPNPQLVISILDGKFIDVNPIFEKYSGFTREELIGKTTIELGIYVNLEDRDKLYEELKRKGNLKNYEVTLKTKSGKSRDCLAYAEIIEINNQSCLLTSIRDITEQKIVEKELTDQNTILNELSTTLIEKNKLINESERKFKNLFDKNPVSLWEEDFSKVKQILDKKKEETSDLKEYLDRNPDFVNYCISEIKLLSVNEQSLKLLGVPDFKELKTQLNKSFTKKSFEAFKIEFLAISSNIKEFSTETEFLRIDGKTVTALIHFVIIDDSYKKVIVSLVDITELNEAKKELLESNRKFKNLFDKNPVSLWEEDYSDVKRLLNKKKAETEDLKKYLNENPDFVRECISKLEILNVNDISLELFGVNDKQELISRLGKTFNENSIEVFKEQLIAISQNKKEFSSETEMIGRDDKIINVLIKFVNVCDDNKAIVSIVDITELHKAKKEIVESELKFKKLFNRNPVSLIEGDYSEIKQLLINKKSETVNLKQYLDEYLEFVHECISKIEILNVNEISIKKLGFTSKKDLSTNYEEIFNENSINAFKELLVAIDQNKKEFSSETELIGRNGKIINVLIKFVNISKDNIAIISIVDITELHKAKEKIVESEIRFRELYEKSGDAILILLNGVFVECNQATVNMLEYESKEEFLDSHPSNLSPKFQQDGQKSFDKAVDMMNMALQQGTHRFEWIHTKKNGEDFPVEVLLTVISDESNNQIIHTVWRDITDRKSAELELKISERELRKSQKIAQLGNYSIDLTTELIKSSSVFDSIVGFSPNDMKTFDQLRKKVHAEDLEENLKMFQNCIKTGKLFDREFRIINGITKELKWIHGLGEFVYKDNKPGNFRGTLQDITERKIVELAVKQNEKKLIEAQKIANLGTYELDLKTNSITTSELYNSIFGIKKKPTKIKGWWKSITRSEDYERTELLWQQCINDCKTYNDEYRILTEDNEIRWVHDIAEIKSKNGQATKVVGTVQDITERKNFEDQIKRSDDILNQINSLVVVNNAKGDIIYISPSVKSILGYEPSDMLGRGWWRLTYADDKLGEKRIKEIFSNLSAENSKPHEVSVRRIKTNNGNYKLIEWHISKTAVNTFISIGIDITEKKEKEEQFKTLTETAHDAIILVDHNGLIFEWNKSSEETFGYSKQEIEGKTITTLMPEKYKLQYEKGFGEVMQKGLKESYRNNIVEGLTKEGVVFPMELSLNFWKSNNRHVYCYFIRDITQREHDEKIKELIFNITNKSNEVLNLNRFFHYIKTELGKLINTDNFFIALYNEKTEMISTPYMVDEIDIASDFPKGKTLTGHVIDTKSALLTKEIIIDPKSEDPRPIGLGPESKCWLGVPMLVENKAIGAIVVQSYTDENAYTRDDVATLELVASNIGHAVRKSEDLRQIRLLNQALVQSPQAVIITNTKGEVEYINPAFTGLSGYSEEEVIGKNPRILKSSKHLPEYYENLWQTISNGKTWEGEFVNKHKDGSSYLVEANISSVKNENGIITHYIGVQEDITEKRKLERQFINTFIDAQEVEKQNFGEELHDSISQILSAEGMYINLLIEQNQDRINDKAKFLTKIKELNTNAVNETRSIAHGLMSSQLKQSGLLIAVENICIDFNNSKNIMFSFLNIDVKEEDLSKEIKTNLFRVIQELTTNITRYSSATNATVEFSKIKMDKLRLIVEDNGIGMDYNKIKNERKITGLKNVERRIIFLNGTLDVDSHPNNGTRWKIIVPLKNIQ